MTRQEFAEAINPSLGFLGAFWQKLKVSAPQSIHKGEAVMMRLTASEGLELMLSLETAIQALATVQELIARHEETGRWEGSR